MEKYIKNLNLRNIGKYSEAKVKFNKKFNFLVGANGCGKTSIIKSIAIILNPGRANVFRYGDNASVWIDCVEGDKSIRIGLGEGWVKDGIDYRKAVHSSWTAPKIDDTVSKA